MITGNVHSIETFGTLDGPGVRTVVFMQGCPLRCKFCHNIDSTIIKNAIKYTVDSLFDKIISCKPYWQSKNKNTIGGVTFSGGDPIMQYEFISEIAKKLKNENVNIAFDTSLYTNHNTIDSLIPFIDLWMISIKHMNSKIHLELTGVENKKIQENILYLDEKIEKSQIRIRYLVIPSYTDDIENLDNFVNFVQKIEHLESIEVLKYGKHGQHKWIELFGNYPFENVREATNEDVFKVISFLKEKNLPVLSIAS